MAERRSSVTSPTSVSPPPAGATDYRTARTDLTRLAVGYKMGKCHLLVLDGVLVQKGVDRNS